MVASYYPACCCLSSLKASLTVSFLQVFENKWLADRDSDLESDCFTEESLEFTGEDGTSPSPRPLALVRQSTPPKTGLHPQWLAPNFEGTADLEWDPSVDVGGSTSHDEEDSSYYSAITGKQGPALVSLCESGRGLVTSPLKNVG